MEVQSGVCKRALQLYKYWAESASVGIVAEWKLGALHTAHLATCALHCKGIKQVDGNLQLDNQKDLIDSREKLLQIIVITVRL
jgi:hypothetical protein